MGGVAKSLGSALGISSPKQPKAPDYTSIAQQQAGLDKTTAQDLTQSNRPTQNAPGGSITWQQDPTTGQWTQNLTYSPDVQAAFDRAKQINANSQNALLNQGEFKGPDQVGAFDASTGNKVADDMYHATMDRAAPLQQRQRDQLITQLRQQGLQQGDQAYDNALGDLDRAQGDVNLTASQNATQGGYNTALQMYGANLQGNQQNYNQDAANYARLWDTASAANQMNGSQYTPQFAGFGTATGYAPADLTGAAQATYQAKTANANSSSGKLGSLLNTGMKGAAGYMGGGGWTGALQGMAS